MGGSGKILALCLIGGLLAAGGLSLASWLLLGANPSRPPQTFDVVIQAGTAERIQAGEQTSVIPSSLNLFVGDTLVLHNEDSLPQQMGPYPIPAGATVQIPLREAANQTYLCTFHPRGTIGFVVKGRSSPLWVIWSTLLLGLPLGGGAAALIWTVRRFDSDELATT